MSPAEDSNTVPTLAEVIATSPVLLLEAPLYVLRATLPVTASPKHLAVIQDEIETTIVTSDEPTVTAHKPTDIEGPFSGFRLQISLSFGAPGFITAATTACATAGLNVFVLSTFSFDYLLVPANDERGARCLGAGRLPDGCRHHRLARRITKSGCRGGDAATYALCPSTLMR